MKKTLVAGIAILGISAFISTNALAVPGATITSGSIALGVNDDGSLNTSDGLIPVNAGALGIAYLFPDGSEYPDGRDASGWQDATSPGCLCEGWGVSGTSGGTDYTGYANVSSDGGANNLTVDSFIADASSITSAVSLTSFAALSVTQAYSMSAAAPGALFENMVTITNSGATTITDLRYVRVMDWDIPLTEFDEFVTIQGTAATELEVSHDDGFESANPLASTSPIDPATLNVDFIDNGADDHGAYFKFNFGDLLAGESKTFSIFYGAAADEAAMLAALGAVGIELYSLGQSNVGDSAGDDTVTYSFGFKGVGGTPIVPSIPEPATMLLFGTGLAGLVGLGRRKKIK